VNDAEDVRRYRFPGLGVRRVALLLLVVGTTLWGGRLMAGILADGGLSALELLILSLFVPTFGWIVVPLWTSVLGAALLALGRDPNTLRPTGDRSDARAPLRTRTALVVPIFDENPDTVAARASAMLDALGATGHAAHFDLHLLSDSRDDRIAAAEWTRVQELRERHPSARIAYRRRVDNEGRKAGNIWEFCGRRGSDYDFMVVLDADSLMGGETLVELVRRMEANPEVGLLQTATTPIRARSLFARAIQFAGGVYGTPLAWGQAFWQGDAANYWGHNAILRVAPFVEHARLPRLSGTPPLGGEILSHDFVEAALLRRAGWRIVFDPTLGASWEEVPASLPAYARRDRRWAQGSLQHLRLLFTGGLHPASRLHLLFGAMAYISSALWCLLLLAGSAYVLLPAASSLRVTAWEAAAMRGVPPLLAVTAVVLFLPKTLGLLHALLRPAEAFGGRIRLVVSALVETLLSVLVAPILMVYHTLFVTQIALGRDVGWRAWMRRTTDIGWGAALRASAPAWGLGLVWTGATLVVSPLFALWLSPILAGLLLAGPLVRWTSGSRGEATRRALFGVPSERTPAPEIRAVESALDRMAAAAEKGAPTDLGSPSGVSASLAAGAQDADAPPESVMYNAERGLFDLRRGRMLRLHREAETSVGEVIALAVEHLDDLGLRRLLDLGCGEASLVVTHHRARRLGWLGTSGAGDGHTWQVPLARGTGASEVVALATARPSGSTDELVRAAPASAGGEAALHLVRLARLLPAVVTVPVGDTPREELLTALCRGEVLSTPIEEVARYAEFARSEIVRVSEAPVPIPGAEASRFVLYREACGLDEHVAVLVGNRAEWPEPVPIRMHSACLTGDLFGSLRCDCGEQLRGSMEYFTENGGGILLYLAQEGRGIGLGNKFRAYSLQETGLDTIDADAALGFGADEREYDIAVGILADLGVENVELLTNNPEKLGALERAGIRVARRQPLFGHLNRHNLPYVKAKVERAGHWLRDMLGQPMAGD